MVFINGLQGPFHKPHGLMDSDIGERCTILFLVYDRCMPEEKQLYKNIPYKAMDIVYKFSPDSPLLGLFCGAKKLQFEDILKECKDFSQNNTEKIGLIKQYLNSINDYLDAEGPLKEEAI